MAHDYFDRHGLLSLGISEAEADALLTRSQATGNQGRPIIEADRLDDLLEVLRQERGEL